MNMFEVELTTKITYGTSQDLSDLKRTRYTLERLYDLFSKSGNGCTEEINTLKGAAHIIDEILRGETF